MTQTSCSAAALRVLLSAALLTPVAACGAGEAEESAGDVRAGAAAPAFGPAAGTDGDADWVEVQDYELTIEDVRRWAEAQANVQRLVAADPSIEAALEGDDDDESSDAGESLDATEARIESVPAARDAIEDAGLSAREYAVILWAMMQAGMAQYALQEGADTTELASELRIHPANIRFVSEHEEEIRGIRQKLAANSGGE